MAHTVMTENNEIPEISAGLVAELPEGGSPRDSTIGDWYAAIGTGYKGNRAYGETREIALERAAATWNKAILNRMEARQLRKKDYEQSFDVGFEDISNLKAT
jgi:hypothetical protein